MDILFDLFHPRLPIQERTLVDLQLALVEIQFILRQASADECDDLLNLSAAFCVDTVVIYETAAGHVRKLVMYLTVDRAKDDFGYDSG